MPLRDTRDSVGEPLGLGVNLRPEAERLVIFLGGGHVGADGVTCRTPTGCNARSMARTWWFQGKGIFDRQDPHNPLADASYVVIPAVNYDRHMGDRTATYVAPRPRPRPLGGAIEHLREPARVACAHRGAANFQAFLQRIAPTFPDVKQVILAGESAGGFGACYHVPRVRKAFRGKELLVVNDSGPYLPPGYELFNGAKVQAWGLRRTVAKGWKRLLPDRADPRAGSWNLYQLTAKLSLRHGPPVRTALITSVWDPVISESYGIPQAEFERAVRALPTLVTQRDPNARVFLINLQGHTWLRNLPEVHSCGAPRPVGLSIFLADFLRNGPGGHVAQPPLPQLTDYAANMRAR